MGKGTQGVGKTYQINLLDNAVENLREIKHYIAVEKQQPLNAIKVSLAFSEMFKKIEKQPWAYKECKEIPTTNHIYRRAVCFDWLIIFKIKEATILIIGIIHGSRKSSKIRQLRKMK